MEVIMRVYNDTLYYIILYNGVDDENSIIIIIIIIIAWREQLTPAVV